MSEQLFRVVEEIQTKRFDEVIQIEEDENGFSDPGIVINKVYKDVTVRQGYFFCPTCNGWFHESEYLRSVISDCHTLWIANMITHHRHVHITHWDKSWGKGGSAYQGYFLIDYETEKSKVNERAKRVLIRKHTAFLKKYGFKKEHFLGLEFNDLDTIKLINTKLGV